MLAVGFERIVEWPVGFGLAVFELVFVAADLVALGPLDLVFESFALVG